MATAFTRTVILYILLMIGLRAMGKRQIGELEPSELVLTMLLSDLAAVPMQDFGIPLLNGIVPILTLLSLSLFFSILNLKSIRFRRLACGEPTLLIDQGQLLQKAMRKNRFTLDELMEQLRSQGITDLKTIKYAVLETSGKLSLLQYEKDLPLTPTHVNRDVKDNVSIPVMLVNDGRLIQENLTRCGKDLLWLQNQVKKSGCDHWKNVFLFSLDNSGNTVCIPKEEILP